MADKYARELPHRMVHRHIKMLRTQARMIPGRARRLAHRRRLRETVDKGSATG